MSAICPDNSTECLLRAILDAQSRSGFNWDPLNFAFTAAIGVLAIIVAGMTVFQGFLTAGPGRLKASKAVLGAYAKQTKTHFDENEFRFQTTATVPIIRHFYHLEPMTSLQRDIKSFPARWVTLLEAAGLFVHENSSSTQIVTDHLPADIAVAPAWATVKAAIQMACMAGCDTVTMAPDSTYPIIRGRRGQLRFREHPDLGTVAMFDLFLKNRIHPLYPVEVKENFRDYSWGPVIYRSSEDTHRRDHSAPDLLLSDLKLRCNGCTHLLCRSLSRGESRNKYFEISPIVLAQLRHIPSTVSQPRKAEPFHFITLLPLVNRIPLSINSIDFTRHLDDRLDTRDSLIILLTLWRYCHHASQEAPFTSLMEEQFQIAEDRKEAIMTLAREDNDLSDMRFGLGRSWLYDPRTVENVATPGSWGWLGRQGMPELSIIRETTHIASAFLTTRQSTPRSMSITARYQMRLQLQALDWWLLHKGGSLAACECLALAFEASGESHIAVLGPFGDKNIPLPPPLWESGLSPNPDIMRRTTSNPDSHLAVGSHPGNQTVDGDQEKKLEIDERERRGFLRTVLLYRATVYTILTQPDPKIVSVVDGELGSRMVQLL